ncbi:MAG: hypothetical protein LBR24_04210 [Methanobrevibacter sp.]|jgi:hypothetical protein|nr:hypothetical protein [Methanobrevibacter sp.]
MKAYDKFKEEYSYSDMDMIPLLKPIRNALPKGELIENTILTRGQCKFYDIPSNVCEIGKFKAFTSASFKRSVAMDFAEDNGEDGVQIRIYAPKGTKGIYLEKISEFIGQFEFMLPEDQKFIILSRDDINKITEILLLIK